MGASAVQHTRHLMGTGIFRGGESVAWWAKPVLPKDELAELGRALAKRSRLRGIWRVSSTFIVEPDSARPILVMLEPLRNAMPREQAVIGIFDLKPLLAGFFASSLPHPYPVQILDGDGVLYQDGDWDFVEGDDAPIVEEDAIAIDAARWTLRMQPGTTPVAQTLSWLNALVIGLGIVAGAGITVIVWILAARTWILQRAVARRTAALRRATERLRELAIRDELTGLYNRRFFLERLEWECDRARRYQRPFACLMIDLNGFKQVNDKLGHQVGDFVLKRVAQELSLALRQSDILARFGGDEFAIALPETTPAQAEAVADKLRSVHIDAPEGPAHGVPAVTLSVGMSRLGPDREGASALLEEADRSLYAWKARIKSSREALTTHN
jgi:diguanylate cyclase (GGDEF)-like protein